MLRFNPNLWALPAWPCAGNRRPHGRAPRWCALGRQELLGGVRPAVRAKPVGLAVPPSCPRTCCWDRKRVPILAHKWTTLRTGLCHQVQRVRPPGAPPPPLGLGSALPPGLHPGRLWREAPARLPGLGAGSEALWGPGSPPLPPPLSPVLTPRRLLQPLLQADTPLQREEAAGAPPRDWVLAPPLPRMWPWGAPVALPHECGRTCDLVPDGRVQCPSPG